MANVCGLTGVECERWQYMDAGIWDCWGAPVCDKLVPRLVGEDLSPRLTAMEWHRKNVREGRGCGSTSRQE